ncbi:MAG: hypothetical protein ATN36_05340 [Epulopiscium sp. Nele67-Bin005]|nr:MAG: hypothetical protein ATN36_05340 [Epulopiscium sp. Nele67-Bin005]
MATIKDVAKEANVAISTVSNVLNNVDIVSEKTREKVLEAAKKLNYVPNLNGKFLKQTRLNVLGLFLTNVEGPFYNQLIGAMHSECRKFGYGLTVFLNDANNVEESIQAILGKRVDGAIILNETIKDNHIEILSKFDMPIVFLDRKIEYQNLKSVVIDNFGGIKLAMEYLISQGITKFGYVHGVSNNYDQLQRYAGYKEILLSNGFLVDERFEIRGEYYEEAAFAAMNEYIKGKNELPQAFVAANDQMAIGCIEALRENGFDVPKDVLIVGFDNIEPSKYYGLTTVDICAEQIGEVAVNIIDNILSGKKPPNTEVPIKLICRSSTMLQLEK